MNNDLMLAEAETDGLKQQEIDYPVLPFYEATIKNKNKK